MPGTEGLCEWTMSEAQFTPSASSGHTGSYPITYGTPDMHYCLAQEPIRP